MTLIMNLTTCGQTLQVSDRLVTLASSGRYAGIHDPHANKAVVLRARDAIVCIGYTGTAYVGGIPTDSRIAEILAGRSFGCGGSTFVWRDPSSRRSWPDIGSALGQLTSELTHEFASLAMAQVGVLSLVMAGWQVYRRGNRIRPICYEIHNNRGNHRRFVVRSIHPRHWAWDRSCQFTTTPQLPTAVKGWLQAESNQAERTGKTYEELMVECIRRVAQTSQVVGRDCMSILIRAFVAPHVVVSYLPDEPATIQLGHKGATHQSQVAYGPWVVTEGEVHAPTLMIGEHTLGLRNLEVLMRAPDPPKGSPLVFWGHSQERPRQP